MENQDEVVKVFKQRQCKAMIIRVVVVIDCCFKTKFKDVNAIHMPKMIKQHMLQECAFRIITATNAQIHALKIALSQTYGFVTHVIGTIGNIPVEAAFNNMALEDISEELKQLNSLGKHLIAIHIPFMKVFALPHGGQQNIHGPVVCVQSDLSY